VLALAAFVVLVSLGNWQMSRLAWKEALIERVSERPTLEALTIEDELLEAPHDEAFFNDHEYRRARLVGRYDVSGEVLVFTALSDAKGPFSGPGYWVVTPFVPVPEAQRVYVNRGFVPEDRKRAYAAVPAGQVTIEGLIRAPEKGSRFTPEANVPERVFFARHPHRIAEATAAKGEVAGFFLDLAATEGPPGGLPQAGETRVTFTNNHLGYAFTWYGLAAALLAVFASFVWVRLRERSQDAALTPPGRHP
jgi:surfeit locus 1 family protein